MLHARFQAPGARTLGRRTIVRLMSGARRTTLAALIERSPQLTPELGQHEAQRARDLEAAEEVGRVYPPLLTLAEEGPDRQRVRLRLEGMLEREGGRLGEGDRTDDESSLDRKLAQRVYLLTRGAGGEWGFPQREWAAPATVRDGLTAAVLEACGEELEVHQMGNAPLAHRELADGSVFYWRMLHVAGGVETAEGTEHAWLTKEEILQRLDPEMQVLAEFLCGPHA